MSERSFCKTMSLRFTEEEIRDLERIKTKHALPSIQAAVSFAIRKEAAECGPKRKVGAA
jgi:hypothetical protein